MGVVVMLARQRSGTGALGSALDQQDQMRYLGEVFHNDSIDREPNYFWYYQQLVRDDPSMALPGAALKRLTGYFEYVESYSGAGSTVIDIKYSSTHHFDGYWRGWLGRPGLLNWLRDLDIPVIHVTRKNLLRVYLSGELAEANKVWHATPNTHLEHRAVTINPRHLKNRMRAMQQESDLVASQLRGHPSLVTIDYAAMFDEDGQVGPRALSEIGEIAGVGHLKPVRPVFSKQVSTDLREAIANYEEVEVALLDTPFNWMVSSP